MAPVDDPAPASDGPSAPSTLGEGTSRGPAAAWEGRPGLSGSASGAFTLGLVSGLCEALPPRWPDDRPRHLPSSVRGAKARAEMS
jgi:hypothetical protein